jgi:hypothetical protein
MNRNEVSMPTYICSPIVGRTPDGSISRIKSLIPRVWTLRSCYVVPISRGPVYFAAPMLKEMQ